MVTLHVYSGHINGIGETGIIPCLSSTNQWGEQVTLTATNG
jgi:hypothetical protein